MPPGRAAPVTAATMSAAIGPLCSASAPPTATARRVAAYSAFTSGVPTGFGAPSGP